jgi:hypothetical protein
MRLQLIKQQLLEFLVTHRKAPLCSNFTQIISRFPTLIQTSRFELVHAMRMKKKINASVGLKLRIRR